MLLPPGNFPDLTPTCVLVTLLCVPSILPAPPLANQNTFQVAWNVPGIYLFTPSFPSLTVNSSMTGLMNDLFLGVSLSPSSPLGSLSHWEEKRSTAESLGQWALDGRAEGEKPTRETKRNGQEENQDRQDWLQAKRKNWSMANSVHCQWKGRWNEGRGVGGGWGLFSFGRRTIWKNTNTWCLREQDSWRGVLGEEEIRVCACAQVCMCVLQFLLKISTVIVTGKVKGWGHIQAQNKSLSNERYK